MKLFERSPTGRKFGNGFTLVELLVALMVFGMISIAMLGTLRFGSQALGRVQSNASGLNDMVQTQLFLAAALKNAVSVGSVEAPDNGANFPAGSMLRSDGAVEFASVWLTQIGQGTIFRFRLFVEDGALKIAWRPAFDESSLSEQELSASELMGQRELLRGVSAVKIRYFGDADGEAGQGWLRSWDAEEKLPDLIEIDIEPALPNRSYWPVLVTRLSS